MGVVSEPQRDPARLRQFFEVFRFSRRALSLVWQTSRRLTILLAVLTLVAGLLPAAVAWVGQLIVDAVVAGIEHREVTGGVLTDEALRWVALEAALVIAVAAVQRGLSACQSLLRAQLGHRVNVMILDKALTLELQHFEDSEFYDKLTRARRQASTRPLSLVNRTFSVVQNAISLSSYAVLLWQLSPWAVLVLVVAGLPSFVAEAKFSGDAFRLFRWRSPETRRQAYLETVLAREDYVKEVKLFGLGPGCSSATARSSSCCTGKIGRSPCGARFGASGWAWWEPPRSMAPTPGSRSRPSRARSPWAR